MRLGTDEDLLKRFGSGKLQIGFPVRPKDYVPPKDDTQEHEQPSESDEPQGK